MEQRLRQVPRHVGPSPGKIGHDALKVNNRSNTGAVTHTRVAGLGDELPLAVDAGVRALAGDPLLPLRHVAGGRRAPSRILGTWDWTAGAAFFKAQGQTRGVCVT